MDHLIYVTKADGTKELFEETKLIDSLERVNATPTQIEEVVRVINKEIHNGVTTGDIYARAFEILRTHSMPAAIKYSLRRALAELGPGGFPFEKYIAALLKEKGYETLVDQVVQGNCVTHEIDIIAWNAKDLIFIEAKFHNEFGFKSDLKVALYVKARFDDLRGKTFSFGGHQREMTQSWLVTNTKFTDQAIKYGECQGMTMLGWNYPAHKNLHDLIEESGLHPFTCLSTLNNGEKRHLLERGVLLCRDVKKRPELLTEMRLDARHIERVLEEISMICGV